MNSIGKVLVNSNNITKSTYIWNTISTVLNSFQAALILVFLTRFGSPTDNSYLVMAFAVANLFFVVGKYGIRQFQVTDVKEEYSFSDYIYFRVFTTILMLLAEVGYVIFGINSRGYTTEKVTIVMIICIYKGVEAFEDVLHGRMQQKGRLDVATKILGCRLLIFIVGSSLTFILTRKLVFSFAVNTIITLVLAVILNLSVLSPFSDDKKVDTGRIKRLLLASTPLFLTMLMSNYISNSPKYVVDGLIADETQTGFNIVFMPAFVVYMMSNFIFNPSLKKMGDYWENKEYDKFMLLVKRLSLIPIIIGIPVCIVGGYIGIPVLQFVYNIDLQGLKMVFILLLISSGMIAMMNLYIMVLTTLRKQIVLFAGFVIGTLILLLGGVPVLKRWDLIGVCFLHFLTISVVTILLIICSFSIIHSIKTNKTDGEKNGVEKKNK